MMRRRTPPASPTSSATSTPTPQRHVGGQRDLVTRWTSWSAAPGGSSSDADGGPGSLVFHVPQRGDGTLGVLGLVLRDAERRPVAFVDVDAWAPQTDPTTF